MIMRTLQRFFSSQNYTFSGTFSENCSSVSFLSLICCFFFFSSSFHNYHDQQTLISFRERAKRLKQLPFALGKDRLIAFHRASSENVFENSFGQSRYKATVPFLSILSKFKSQNSVSLCRLVYQLTSYQLIMIIQHHHRLANPILLQSIMFFVPVSSKKSNTFTGEDNGCSFSTDIALN